MRSRLLAAGSFLGLVVLVTACAPSLPRVDVPIGVAETPQAPIQEIVEVREYFPLSQFDDFRIPQLVGLTLDTAKDQVEEWDLYVTTEDASGEDESVWLAGNWTVVSQSPRMGTPMKVGQQIEFGVLKTGESERAVAEFLADDAHIDESRFTGVITGYGEPDDIGARTIMVDAALVRLDLIEPIPENCGIELDAGLTQARLVKEALLAVGKRVLVVRGEERSDRGFVHLTDEVSGLPIGTPPLGSANELLVRSGWWVPDELAFTGGFVTYNDHGVSFESFVPDANLAEVRALYAPPIARAGNDGVAAETEGLGLCKQQAESDAESWQKALAESDERMRKWEIEYQKRVREGYYNCRDGDGDGVCYER